MKEHSSSEELDSPGTLKSDSQELKQRAGHTEPAGCLPLQLLDTVSFCAPVLLHSPFKEG